MRTAVITGLGFITSIGLDRPTVTASLRTGRSGVAPHTFGLVNSPITVAAPVPGFDVSGPNHRDWYWPSHYEIPRETLRGLAPHGVYAYCALEQALADARLAPAALTDGRTGLHTASAGSALLAHHHLSQQIASSYQRGHPLSIVQSIAGTLNFNLAAHYGITGSVAGFISACASSSHALGYALDEIRLGRQDRILVIGAEDLNAATDLPFAAMGALSPNPDPATASRPFDRDRDGFVATGGAVALIIEEKETALARCAPIYAELHAWGQAADGHHLTNPHPEGAGLARAIRHTLTAAKLTPADIDYINAHATSTPAGDLAEIHALQSVFTAAGAHPAISSTKSLTGHGLSMSGALETALCALALHDGFIPGNHHLQNPDPATAGLNLPRATLDQNLHTALNLSSGFGGSNVALLLRQL